MPGEHDKDGPTARLANRFVIEIAPAEGARRRAMARLNELVERNRWLVNLRWLAVAGLLTAATVSRYVFKIPLPAGAIYSVAAILFACNCLFWHLARRTGQGAAGLATVQIVIDLVVLTVLLHFSGGVENPFFFYFIFHMVIASILLSRKASFYVATLAVALFMLLVVAEHSGLVTHYSIWGASSQLYLDDTFIFAVLAVFSSTMYMAVYFASDIVERMRARDAELISVTANLERGTMQLQEAYRRIRGLEIKKSDFLRTAAHQLRSPLSAIRSLLDVVLDGFAGDVEDQRHMLNRAHARTGQMLEMVNDLLALSRLKDADSFGRTESQRVSACRIVGELSALYGPRAQEKGVRLEMTPPPESCSIIASADDIRQIFNNLLDNAINYTPSGGKVTLTAETTGSILVVKVSDTGIGISPEHLGRIFEEFYRAPNAKEAVSHGTGLGLAIVKETAEKWGASIDVESKPGAGTTFRLEFTAAG